MVGAEYNSKLHLLSSNFEKAPLRAEYSKREVGDTGESKAEEQRAEECKGTSPLKQQASSCKVALSTSKTMSALAPKLIYRAASSQWGLTPRNPYWYGSIDLRQ